MQVFVALLGCVLVAPQPVALRLMDQEDAKDRAELVERHARLKAMEKLAEQKK